MQADALTTRLGYRFKNPALLRTALTHRSHSSPHNERLEFLGDSVLNCIVADALYERFPQLTEGELSRARAIIVRQQSLFERACELELGALLHLGEGEVRSGGAQRPSILADALEALVGAVYLDGGFSAARKLVHRILRPVLARSDPAAVLGKDAKTLLQEHLQGRHIALPRYNIVGTEGEAHRQNFTVECVIAQLSIRTLGEGLSRRAAEQQAARLAYDRIAAQ
ncbi:MAG: ribonuclease III [Burkholderiales bacterium]|nr:ribonuclease III [Burkholderiales bacterium]